MSDEYLLRIQIKNNLLFSAMRERGIETQSELARAVGITPTAAGEVANLKVGAFRADGSLSKVAQLLCEFFGCTPEDIYPEQVLYQGLPTNTVDRVLSADQVSDFILEGGRRDGQDPLRLLCLDEEEGLTFDAITAGLRSRERDVLEMRFVSGLTLEECGTALGVTRERVREIQSIALRSLRKFLARHAKAVRVSGAGRIADDHSPDDERLLLDMIQASEFEVQRQAQER